MQYILTVSSFGGIVAWAVHYRGRIRGEHPRSCHGGTCAGNWHLDKDDPRYGRTTCAEGHVLPKQIEWDVEAPWTEAQYRTWVENRFEGAGPEQFLSKEELLRVARQRFLGELPRQSFEDDKYPLPQPGDELWYGWVNDGADDDLAEEDGWGTMLCKVPG